MVLLLCTATLLGSNGKWYSFSELPHCWGALGTGTPSVHCHTATLLGSSGQWYSFTALLHRGQWAVVLL